MNAENFEDAMLLALKVGKEAMSQGEWTATRSWTIQGCVFLSL